MMLARGTVAVVVHNHAADYTIDTCDQFPSPVHEFRHVGLGAANQAKLVDAFTSALLASLHGRGLLGAGRRERLHAIDAATLAEVLDSAVLASAITCTRRGAEPPTRAEL